MKTQVIIVGAGPAGLCLALSLAKFNIQSVILEKRAKITSDPRGVYLTGDAVRILCHLGIADDLADIGHNARFVKFHQSSYSAPTLLTLNAGASNALQQAVPEGLLQMQPRLERALRRKIKASPYIKLLLGCEVTAMIAQEPPTIEYINASNAVRRITGQWLIGADGKAGIVRKYFLEPIAGIKQQPGTHFYDGTSIASNLKITLPTPQSHPRFPLWALGYSPEDVYDLFWPEGWHFCFPPGKPTAGGRFGPHHERLWRHEFRHEDGIASQRDAEMLFWDHLLPMITLGGDKIKGLYGHNVSVQFPRDCINILRCRPFRFTHKVVNQWFHGRTVLIGDAAHVFPPFAGQGIASGMRDAHQLAWRLSLLIHQCPVQLNTPMASWATELLQSWAEERRHSVDHTAGLSVGIGHMLQKPPPAMARLGFKMKSGIDRSSARLANAIDPLANNERRGFRDVKEGFFVKNLRGGARLAQIYLESWLTGQRVLSDSILSSSPSAFTLIVIASQWNSVTTRVCKATIAVQNASLHPSVLTEDSIVVYYSPDSEEESDENGGSSTHKEADLMQLYQPHILDPLAPESTRCGGYDAQAYLSRLGSKTKFALVRADFFVFACAKTYSQLLSSLSQLQGRLSDETTILQQ